MSNEKSEKTHTLDRTDGIIPLGQDDPRRLVEKPKKKKFILTREHGIITPEEYGKILRGEIEK